MKKNKTQKGITLIALIVSIVVLLILAVVTIGSVKDSGIINHAQNAALQTEIAQIKEAFELKKSEKLLESVIDKTTNTGFTLNDLDISDNLKSKYGTKLTISGGKLYYVPTEVTDAEKTYFEKQGISSLPQQNPDGSDADDSTFKIAVKNAVKNTTKTGDYYNLVTIKNAVKQEYPNAVDLLLTNDYNADPIGIVFSESDFSSIASINSTIVLCYQGEELEVDTDGNVNDYSGNVILMNDLEAMNIFGLKRVDTGELELISYKGADSTIEVPTVLYDDGNITEIITKISDSAFVKNLDQPQATSLVKYADINNSTYGAMTINQVFSNFGFGTYSGSNGDSTDDRDKIRAIYYHFLSGNFGSSVNTTSSMIYDANLIPSMYVEIDGSEITFLKRTTAVDIENITLSNHIITISANAFKDQTSLKTITITSGYKPSIDSTAFSGCTGLVGEGRGIYFETNTTANEITSLEGFSTRWGAPEGTKIYLNGIALN